MSQRISAIICVGGLALVSLMSGCSRQAVPESVVAIAPEVPPPLARVNDRVFTEADLEYEVQRRIANGRPVGDAEAVLKDLVEREVMLQAARASDWMKDPDVQRELENQELSRWLAHTLQKQKDEVTISDEALQEAYEADLAAFTKPALIRLAVLYRKASPKDPDAKWLALQDELETAREAFRADPEAARQGGRMLGFGAIAAKYSEETTSRYRGGDIGWLTPGADSRWPREVLDAGSALELNQMSEVLITEQGLYIVMKTDARPAQVTPLAQVASSLRRRLIHKRQADVQADFLADLMGNNEVEMNPELISDLAVLPSSLAGESSSFQTNADPQTPFVGARP